MFVGIGPQAGASQIVGSDSLPVSPTFRQVYITPAGFYSCFTDGTWTLMDINAGDGTVTSVSVTTANGVSGVVANASTTPAITLTLGAIVPTSVNGLTISTTTGTLTLTNGKTISIAKTMSLTAADDTGVYTLPTGTKTLLATDGTGTGLSGVTLSAVVPNTAPSSGQLLAGNAGGTAYAPVSMSGDATLASTGALTLASTILAGGPTGSSTVAPIITYDAKGRLTAVSSATITPAVGSITGLGTGVATALGVNVGSAGAVITFNGNAGTPSALVGTNITGTAAGLTAGTASAVAVGGITGLGAGAATALAVNVGTAGAFVVNGGALGSPSTAGTLPAHTLGGTISGGGNQINNVVIGTSTPLVGTFTTLVGTTVNGLTITNNGTNTLSITAGKTETFLKTMSFTSADDTGVYTLPTGTKTLLATDGVGTSLTGIPYTLTGTANQVTLSAGTGNITFSLPQSIATTSTPQFARIGLGTTSVSNYGIASTLTLAVSGTNSLQAFGVGVPGDANTEYVDIFHNGASNAFFIVNKSGSGSYRALDIRTGGNQTILLGTDQSATFPGVIKNTGITSDATHTDSAVCQDTTTHQFYTGSGAAGICLGTSSARFKHSLSDVKEGLSEILRLRARNFRYKKGIVDSGARLQYGLVAEEVNEIIPNVVARGAKGEINSVDYGALWPIFVKAFQEMHEQFDAKVELLNVRLNTLLETHG